MERTNIIVWLDNSEYWHRVFLKDGKLLVKCDGRTYKPIEECNVRKVDSLV